ncbi:CHAT domain-containing tetratricopeptide repeat protein [Bradyrhizobium guangdongense]|uniref:CHAT domain-containing protein n=1 Tax=Bradyrhizobium guangdongense TaxID=1325090 RepID=A0A410V0F1_9BRAD|nr:tetratricopeptide repeat protein [Bradyrhizobium guangdongense]QAU37150.1 hypothetical protein X265_05205 [Bradyrhizobium guangdongense]QOZ58204.1 hypothetical protein XH86_05200 [Bradyrhizobium guangdongense]GGI21021.1 hypothetical protein GCM10010987_12290 [Bradyrhizobium guangdongense]
MNEIAKELGVLGMLNVEAPEVVRLAAAVSIASRIEPFLLRRARLELCRGMDAGVELELWHSELVQAHSPRAMTLHPRFAHELQIELRGTGKIDEAYELLKECHKGLPEAILLEEEITWRILRGEIASERVKQLLRRATASLVEGGQPELAHWASRFLTRAPKEIQNLPEAWVLSFAASSRLGGARVLQSGEPPAGIQKDELHWAIANAGQDGTLHVGLRDDRLVLSLVAPSDTAKPAHPVPIPLTDPIIIEVDDGQAQGPQLHQLDHTGKQILELPLTGPTLKLTTVSGNVYEVAVPVVAAASASASPDSPSPGSETFEIDEPASVDNRDFELEISGSNSNTVGDGGREYYARVIRSPAGGTPRCPVRFAFSGPQALEKLRSELEYAVLEIGDKNRSGRLQRGESALRDFGRDIFRSIFIDPAPIRNIYARSKGLAALRIRLRIECRELEWLPWEYLYDEEEMPAFVSLSRPVVRSFETQGTVARMGVKGPLRILGMIADPATSEWPKLDVSRERDRVNQGLDRLQREGRVDFQWLPGGTGKDLMKKLLEGDWHVFHFIGHAGVEAPVSSEDGTPANFDEQSFIVMSDDDGKPVKKFASDLALMLQGARRSLRLVVLNHRESTWTNGGLRFGNPAIGLIRSGWLPAVVATPSWMSDNAAITMSEGFYAALASGRPVEEAVTLARKFIQEKSRVEWGIPVLYMGSGDGKIFDIASSVLTKPAAGVARDDTLSGEELSQRRQEFLLDASKAQQSTDELERLTARGRELLLHVGDDQELAARVARLYFDLGTLQHRQKDIAKAAASFAYMLQFDPTKPEYRVRRANFNVTVGLYENALTDIAEAIRLEPDNAEFYWIKGIICMTATGADDSRSYIEEAIKSFDTAILIKPLEPKYLASRANAYAQLKRYSEALSDINAAIALAPENPDLVTLKLKITSEMS